MAKLEKLRLKLSGTKLLAASERGGRSQLLASLEEFVDAHLVAPIFDTLLPELLRALAASVGLGCLLELVAARDERAVLEAGAPLRARRA